MKIIVKGDVVVLLMAALLMDLYGTVAGFCTAVCIHEFSHILTVHICHGKTELVTFGIFGGVIEYTGINSYYHECAVAVSGAVGNLVFAYFASAIANITGISILYTVAGVNVALACFNILPICPLDGGNALHALICIFSNPERADFIVKWTGFAASFIISALGVYILIKTRYNITMLLCGGYLAVFCFLSAKQKSCA